MYDVVPYGRFLQPLTWGPDECKQVGPVRLPHFVLPRHHLRRRVRVKIRGVGDAELVRPGPWVSLHGQHRHVLDSVEIQQTIRPEVRPVGIVPHEVPSGSTECQEMITSVVLPPRGLRLNVVNQSDGERVALRDVRFTELAGGVEPTVEWDVEQIGNVGIACATRMTLHTRVEDHLGYELMGGEPTVGGGGDGGDLAAEAAICHVGTHVGVDVEVAAVFEKADVKLGRQVVNVDIWTSVASGDQMVCLVVGISSFTRKIVGFRHC